MQDREKCMQSSKCNWEISSSHHEKTTSAFPWLSQVLSQLLQELFVVVAPLTDLLKGKARFVWSSSCQQAFDNVKSGLCSPPVVQLLAWNDLSNCMWMQTMWGQEQRCSRQMVAVHFYPRKFNSFQLNYSVIEKETLALIWALQHFDVYVGSSVPLVVYTDHNPITFLHSVHCPNRRLMRWMLYLQSYCLDIRHIKGSDNVVADALSRAPSS